MLRGECPQVSFLLWLGFQLLPQCFLGFGPRCSSIYRLPHAGCGQAWSTEALAILSSTPHASHSSPECPQNSTHEEKNSHLSTLLLQWDGIPHSISQWFLEHIYTGLALGSPLLGPHNSTHHTPWHTLWPVPYLCVGALQAPNRTKFHKTSHTSRFLSSCSCCRPRKGQKKDRNMGQKDKGRRRGRGVF